MYSYVLSFHSCWRCWADTFRAAYDLSFSPSPSFPSSDSEHITREREREEGEVFEKGVSLDMIQDTDSLALGPPFTYFTYQLADLSYITPLWHWGIRGVGS